MSIVSNNLPPTVPAALPSALCAQHAPCKRAKDSAQHPFYFPSLPSPSPTHPPATSSEFSFESMNRARFVALLVALRLTAADAGTEKTLTPTALRARPPLDAHMMDADELDEFDMSYLQRVPTPSPATSPAGATKAICATERACCRRSAELGLAPF